MYWVASLNPTLTIKLQLALQRPLWRGCIALFPSCWCFYEWLQQQAPFLTLCKFWIIHYQPLIWFAFALLPVLRVPKISAKNQICHYTMRSHTFDMKQWTRFQVDINIPSYSLNLGRKGTIYIHCGIWEMKYTTLFDSQKCCPISTLRRIAMKFIWLIMLCLQRASPSPSPSPCSSISSY